MRLIQKQALLPLLGYFLFLLSLPGFTQTFTTSNLPIIKINTQAQTIVDDPKIVCDMAIIDHGYGNINDVTETGNNYVGKIAIEIRGSSSQTFPQKSYGFKTVFADSTERNISLLHLPAEHDWILYAPYTDKALMRNVMAYHIARQTGHYASRTRFCELVIDNQYQGIYVLMEKIKRDTRRVNISKLKTTDINSPEVSGGYLLKIDKFTGSGGAGFYSNYKSPNNGPYPFLQYDYPDPDEITTEQSDYIQNSFKEMEDVLASSSYDNTTTGYASYLNVPSFVDYLLLNEVSRNVDGYRLSAYIYKDRDDNDHAGKYFAGPAWDYNLAFYNADYCRGQDETGWAYNFPYDCAWDGYQPPFWWERLLEDTVFQNKVKCRWDNLRSDLFSTTTLATYIDNTADTLDEAQARHFIKWPILGNYVWPNPDPSPTTYSGEIANMKTWLNNRLNWIDGNIQGNCLHQPGYIISTDGNISTNDILVRWSVLFEKNVTQYEIEISTDNQTFQTIGTRAAGNLNTNTNYTYTYFNPAIGEYYLRVKKISTNNMVEYSDVVVVNKKTQIISSITNQLDVSNTVLYPNPFDQEFSFNFIVKQPGKFSFELMDPLGRIVVPVYTRDYTEGEQSITFEGLKKIPTGQYLLKISTAEGMMVLKLMKR